MRIQKGFYIIGLMAGVSLLTFILCKYGDVKNAWLSLVALALVAEIIWCQVHLE